MAKGTVVRACWTEKTAWQGHKKGKFGKCKETTKALNSRAEIAGLGWRDLIEAPSGRMDRTWQLVSVGRGRREESVQEDPSVLVLGDRVNGEALIRPEWTAEQPSSRFSCLADQPAVFFCLFFSSFLKLFPLTLEGLTSPHACPPCGATKTPCWQPCSAGVITSPLMLRAGTSLTGTAHTLGMFLPLRSSL